MRALTRRINDWPFGLKIGVTLALVGILPVAITAVVLSTSAANALQENAFNELAAVGHLKLRLLEGWLEERASDASIVSERQVIVGNLEGDEGISVMSANKANRDGSEFQFAHARALSQMDGLVANKPYYNDVMLFDTDGDIMVQTNREEEAAGIETNVANEEFFQRGLEGPYTSSIVNYERANEQTMFISHPVYNLADELAGVLVLQINLQEIDTIMQDRTGLGESGETYLVGAEGLMLTQSRFTEEPTRLVQEVNTVGVARALEGGDGTDIYPDYRGISVLGHYEQLPATEDAILTEIDEAEVLAPVRQERLVSLIAAVIAALAAVGAGLLFSNLLTRQVDEIEAVFRRVGIGEFETQAQVFSRDELGRTADGINAMLRQLNTLITRSQAQLQGVIGSATDAIITVDENHNVVMFNRAAEQLFGKRFADVEGTPLNQFIPSRFHEAHVRHLHRFGEAGATARAMGRALDLVAVRRDGTEFPIEANISQIEVGGRKLFTVIMREITERKVLLDNLSRQTAIINNVNDFVGYSDMDGVPQFINPAGLEMIGYGANELGGLNIGDFYPPFERARINEEALPTAHQHGLWTGELTMVRKDGSTFPVFQAIVPIVDEAGHVVANGTIIRDITDQRRVQVGVQDTASQVTEASQAMAETVRLMVEQAANSAQVAERASGSAREGDQAVSATIAAMNRIRENTQETARRIKRLGEASQEIGEVVRIIEEVSDRTTVLALNASIQAAAAGEAGRGFAVVAEEVQRLAERAASSTRQIEQLVQSIQAETNEAVVGIDEATREVVAGSDLAEGAGAAMAELSAQVDELATLIQHVAETTARQTNESLANLGQMSGSLQASVAAFASPGGASPAGMDGDGYSSQNGGSRN